ncbi:MULTISPECIES: DUF1273 domain-containing protein [Peribacillus]|uniref:DUF1273 domain-containing protein n=1 Tax=Peribacillus TaxID=2675229 RepID=UPI001F4DD974|nr:MULTISPECIES: DUF1273 domain-containing protein [unclassified Peribacillus]MCK1982492.1 DUF1273 domain-containing protein [Peribacillus sp. Aquil_B1]MCK2008001.1 DUF1273 domain-containing protein [Peribacillus sp. Aquil_B8]
MKVLYMTGYKAFEFGIFKNDHEAVKYIKKAMKERLMPLVEDGLEWVIISGQLGTELWGAEVVFELKKEYHQLKLGVLTPFLNQEESWNETNQDYYRSILDRADFVESIFNKPYEGPQQLKTKNRYMVHKSDAMLIIFEAEKEGSARYPYFEAMKKAETQPYPIFQINFDDLQLAAEEANWSEE